MEKFLLKFYIFFQFNDLIIIFGVSLQMFNLLIWAFILYAVYKIVRRKLCNPNFEGKVVWITGASSGIGEYMAYQFNKRGAQLIISARNQNQLKRVKQSCAYPDKITILKLDMTNYKAVEEKTAQVLDNLEKNAKKLYMVVQNAGVSMRCEFKDYPFENHLSMFNVNVNGPYRHIQCVLEHMIKNKEGHIVGISSVAGKLGPAYRSSYAGSKHAMIGIFDSLRSQLKPQNIKVTTILPGYVKTNISKNALAAEAGKSFGKTDTNIEKGMQVDAFAAEAVKAIYRGENEVQISKSFKIPAGIFIRNLCPDLAFFSLWLNSKNQTKAVKQAKND